VLYSLVAVIVYGFKFPDETPDASVHLSCYRHWTKQNPDLLPRHEHLTLAIRSLWPEKMHNRHRGLIWDDEWCDSDVRAWCYHEYVTVWGASATGKSTRCAAIILADWYSAPAETFTALCSTSLEMIQKKIWREVCRLHNLLRGKVPGKLFRNPPRLLLQSDEEETGETTISGIFCVAALRGKTEEGVGHLSGMHNRYNRLVIDEGQAVIKAAYDAWDNLGIGPEPRCWIMGNPTSRLDMLCQASEPENGWGSISPAKESWKSKKGICLYRDGLKSPGVRDPKRYWFLLTQKQIDSMARDPGRDSPRFWTQRRGFVPPEGLTQTVFTENFVEKYHVKDKAIWQQTYQTVAGVDPAWSTGGDKAVMSFVRVGLMTNGMHGVEFQPPIMIQLALSSGQPLTDYMAETIMEHLRAAGITPAELALDTTGAQRALADRIDSEWNKSLAPKDHKLCLRVPFGGSASDRACSVEDKTPASDAYANRVTELWYQIREFALHDQVRGMDTDALAEFCDRQILPRTDSRARIILEPKTEMKARTGGRSPDNSDSKAAAIEYVCSRLGILPGQGIKAGSMVISDELLQREAEAERGAYLSDPFEEAVKNPELMEVLYEC